MILVRELLEPDISEVVDLLVAVSDELLWLGTEPGFDRAERARRFAERLGDREHADFVATSQGRVVGSCGTFAHPVYGRNIGIVIAQAFRGRGIGRLLMERLEQWASARGVRELALLVFAHNARARALYAGLGYEERDFFERDVVRRTGDVFDTILMAKALRTVRETAD